jgi:hypothetical protein
MGTKKAAFKWKKINLHIKDKKCKIQFQISNTKTDYQHHGTQ